MTTTNIEWTDKTWNPVTGCTKVSPGCAHCYAEGVADRFWAKQYPKVEVETGQKGALCSDIHVRPRQFTDVRTHADRLDQPFHWKKPARIFVNSMSDLFHEDVPFAFIDQVLAVMALTPQHTYQILTKRAYRMHEYFAAPEVRDRVSVIAADMDHDPDPDMVVRFWPLLNVWLGVSVENQHWAENRIPFLLGTPAAVRFISAEPLLGPVDLTPWLPIDTIGGVEMERWLDWVIVGGESGPSSRPFDLQWAHSILRQCKSAGVPAFMKQLGAQWYDSREMVAVRGACVVPVDCAFRWVSPRGKWDKPAQWPDGLQIREFPSGR